MPHRIPHVGSLRMTDHLCASPALSGPARNEAWHVLLYVFGLQAAIISEFTQLHITPLI
jgi:hypothetical protein